jgi:hypothetical protein
MADKKWNTVEYPTGPYIPALNIENKGTAMLINKNTYEKYPLSPTDEEIAMLFASKLINEDQAKEILADKVYIKNFWATFNHPIDLEFKDVDWSNVIDHVLRKRNKDMTNDTVNTEKIIRRRYKYGKIFVDDIEQMLDTYSLPPASIHYGGRNDPNRGKVKHGILPEDVTLNLSIDLGIPQPQYNWKDVIEDRSELWVAKWDDPITGITRYIDIKPSIEDEFEEEIEEIYDIDDDEREIIGYEELDDDDEDIIKEYDINELVPVYQKQRETIEPEDDIKLADLTEDEHYLPLSYLVGELEQWSIMNKACKSGFKIVNHMDKVIDKHLMTLIDAVIYAVREKGIRTPVHDAILSYGNKRKLL